MPTNKQFKNLIGLRFGRLTVIGLAGKLPRKTWFRYFWTCACDCSKYIVVPSVVLSSGNTCSCGCLCRDLAAQRCARHGKFESPEYGVWEGVIRRCLNPKSDCWENYGGRGIGVCDRWRDFQNFYSDMGRRPSPKHTIDRINNDGDYEPGNCRWATRIEQANNTRSSHWMEFDGKRLTIAGWSRELGINKGTIAARIRSNWSIGNILTQPVKQRARNDKMTLEQRRERKKIYFKRWVALNPDRVKTYGATRLKNRELKRLKLLAEANNFPSPKPAIPPSANSSE